MQFKRACWACTIALLSRVARLKVQRTARFVVSAVSLLIDHRATISRRWWCDDESDGSVRWGGPFVTYGDFGKSISHRRQGYVCVNCRIEKVPFSRNIYAWSVKRLIRASFTKSAALFLNGDNRLRALRENPGWSFVEIPGIFLIQQIFNESYTFIIHQIALCVSAFA